MKRTILLLLALGVPLWFAVLNVGKGSKCVHPLPPENQNFLVIDASLVDHSGNLESCVEYVNRYKDFHQYVIVTPK